MSKRAVCLLMSLLLFLVGTAYGKGKRITILAPVTCADWIDGRKASREIKPLSFNYAGMRNEFWLLGLVTGLNANLNEPNLLDSVDSNLIFDWMDQYCDRNQSASVFRGADELLVQMSRRLKR